MLSTPTLHPFLSHFPTALFVAGLGLLFLGQRRSNALWMQAASLNFSIGLLAAVLAVLTGMFAADLQLRPTMEVEGHQGFSFAFVLVYVICTVYSYTRAWSRAALGFYILNLGLMAATAWSGYLLVFQSTG